ncbi:MAG: hypothetical protein OQJ89_00125 [Kangiellaceae bacterium]|nr:hypothetical protein [Kangiellaceae bacterium]MCW9015344.1 hypothetical protein [Kangiellaceae bacterium]
MKSILLFAAIIIGSFNSAKACLYLEPMAAEKYHALVVDAHTIFTGRVVEMKALGPREVLVTLLRKKLWKGMEQPLYDIKVSQYECDPKFEINSYYIVALNKEHRIAGRGGVEVPGGKIRKPNLLSTLKSIYEKAPEK